jgi:acylphosphatase
MSNDHVRAHVFVKGRVQGVAYRFFAERTAVRAGVTGWVRNLADGRVEVLVEGPVGLVEDFLEQLKAGPRLARVDKFDLRFESPTGEFRDFRIAFPND